MYLSVPVEEPNVSCTILLHGNGSLKWPGISQQIHSFAFIQTNIDFILPVSDSNDDSLGRCFLDNLSGLAVRIAC